MNIATRRVLATAGIAAALAVPAIAAANAATPSPKPAPVSASATATASVKTTASLTPVKTVLTTIEAAKKPADVQLATAISTLTKNESAVKAVNKAEYTAFLAELSAAKTGAKLTGASAAATLKSIQVDAKKLAGNLK